MKTLKTFLLYGLILAAVGAAIYVSFAPRSTLVDSALVSRGPLQVSIVEEGKTRVVDRYIVSAPIEGYARRLQLKVGDTVEAGQVLLRLDPPAVSALDPRSRSQAESRVATAEASLAAALEEMPIARADSRYWETELPRIREGVEAGLIASRELTQAEASQRTAEAKLDAAESKAGVARAELEAAKTAMRLAAPQSGTRSAGSSVAVRAPSAGRVLKIINESEGIVNASQPLVELGNTQGLEVEVEVLSSDAVQITPGMRVLLERWGGENPLEAIVRLVEPVAFTKISALGVEEQRVLVIVDLTAPREQWQSLGDQYRVEARFIVWEEPNVLQAPSSALFRHEDGWATFRADDGVAHIQSVEVGRRGGINVQILSGLSEGDRIINHPGDTIADGGLIEVQQP